MPANIHFFYLSQCPALRDRNKLKAFLPTLFRQEKKVLSTLTYIFCSDRYLLNINRSYLKHDNYTDIMTFYLSADPSCIEGEIYISIERVRDNARINNVTIKEELHRVIFHGALHLCGYKDKTKLKKNEMKKKENKYLKQYL